MNIARAHNPSALDVFANAPKIGTPEYHEQADRIRGAFGRRAPGRTLTEALADVARAYHGVPASKPVESKVVESSESVDSSK